MHPLADIDRLSKESIRNTLKWTGRKIPLLEPDHRVLRPWRFIFICPRNRRVYSYSYSIIIRWLGTRISIITTCKHMGWDVHCIYRSREWVQRNAAHRILLKNMIMAGETVQCRAMRHAARFCTISINVKVIRTHFSYNRNGKKVFCISPGLNYLVRHIGTVLHQVATEKKKIRTEINRKRN